MTFTGLIPDLHHCKGSFGGRAFPLWEDAEATVSNLPPKLVAFLAEKYGKTVVPEDFIAYIAAVASHPGIVAGSPFVRLVVGASNLSNFVVRSCHACDGEDKRRTSNTPDQPADFQA
jgi:hypothetical protein